MKTLIKPYALIKIKTQKNYMHQQNTGSWAELFSYCFGSAESTTCLLLPDLADDLLLLLDSIDLLLLLDGVDLLLPPEGADILRISQKELDPGDPDTKMCCFQVRPGSPRCTIPRTFPPCSLLGPRAGNLGRVGGGGRGEGHAGEK
jgi:hypothetical protein